MPDVKWTVADASWLRAMDVRVPDADVEPLAQAFDSLWRNNAALRHNAALRYHAERFAHQQEAAERGRLECENSDLRKRMRDAVITAGMIGAAIACLALALVEWLA